jgi:hypothetical protein
MTPMERVEKLRQTAHHIARWDPVAAGKVLDLLHGVFDTHEERYRKSVGLHCGSDYNLWPCADYTAALAVLDALDGGGAT